MQFASEFLVRVSLTLNAKTVFLQGQASPEFSYVVKTIVLKGSGYMVDGCIRKTLYISQSEAEEIQQRADKAEVSFSKYIVDCATHGDSLIDKKIVIQYEDLDSHTREIAELRKSINMILNIVFATKEVYEADIKTILSLMERIEKLEIELTETIEHKRTQIKKEAKRLIENRLQRGDDSGNL